MNPTIGLHFGMTTENCFAFNSGAPLKTCNRVCHTNIPTDQEIQRIKDFFGALPCTWFVNTEDTASKEALEKNGLNYKASFPSMILDLELLEQHSFSDDIVVQEINITSPYREEWINIIAQSFGATVAELSQMITIFHEKIPYALKLYVGFYQGKAVSAGMFINHGDVVSLHWIGTLQEFRNKGVGSALTQKALMDFKQQGCDYAVLTATSHGKPLYERMGFKEFALFDVYGNY
jgi:ribosomal protein S18 acetylase RimI-like enzyme